MIPSESKFQDRNVRTDEISKNYRVGIKQHQEDRKRQLACYGKRLQILPGIAKIWLQSSIFQFGRVLTYLDEEIGVPIFGKIPSLGQKKNGWSTARYHTT